MKPLITTLTHRYYVRDYLGSTRAVIDEEGNVWEWCNDWLSEEYSENSVIDPQGASSGEKRVVRGGGWDLINDSYCRVSYKSAVVPNHKCDHIGFRLVVSAE